MEFASLIGLIGMSELKRMGMGVRSVERSKMAEQVLYMIIVPVLMTSTISQYFKR